MIYTCFALLAVTGVLFVEYKKVASLMIISSNPLKKVVYYLITNDNILCLMW
jgi:hypothetical protein